VSSKRAVCGRSDEAAAADRPGGVLGRFPLPPYSAPYIALQDGERDMVGPGGVTAHELIECPQVTLLGAPDQPLVRSRPDGP
jgi:hypothetical protein